MSDDRYKVRKYLIVFKIGKYMDPYTRRADSINALKELIKEIKERYNARYIKLYKYVGYVDDWDEFDWFTKRHKLEKERGGKCGEILTKMIRLLNKKLKILWI